MKQLQWLETEVLYRYDYEGKIASSIETRASKGQKDSFGVKRHGEYLTAEDAVVSQRWEAKQQLDHRLQRVLQSLQMFRLETFSLDSMQELESKIIDLLDAQSQSDSDASGQCVLEKKLSIVQEAIHCLHYKSLIASRESIYALECHSASGCAKSFIFDQMSAVDEKKYSFGRMKQLLKSRCLTPEINQIG